MERGGYWGGVLVKKLLFYLLLLILLIPQGQIFAKGNSGGNVQVDGYFRKDGTYVAPHYRSAPNSTPWDNWSTKGNVNPYTGKPGTIIPYSGGTYTYPLPSITLPSNPTPYVSPSNYYTPIIQTAETNETLKSIQDRLTDNYSEIKVKVKTTFPKNNTTLQHTFRIEKWTVVKQDDLIYITANINSADYLTYLTSYTLIKDKIDYWGIGLANDLADLLPDNKALLGVFYNQISQYTPITNNPQEVFLMGNIGI